MQCVYQPVYKCVCVCCAVQGGCSVLGRSCEGRLRYAFLQTWPWRCRRANMLRFVVLNCIHCKSCRWGLKACWPEEHLHFPRTDSFKYAKLQKHPDNSNPIHMWSNVHLQKHFLIFKVFCGCKFQCSFILCFIIIESERNYCQVGRYFLKPSYNICTYCNALVTSVEQSVGSDQQEMCQK